MDKSLLLGAALGAAVAGGSLTAIDAVHVASAGVGFRSHSEFVLSEAQRSTAEKLMASQDANCAPRGFSLTREQRDGKTVWVGHLECWVTPKLISDVPPGVALENE